MEDEKNKKDQTKEVKIYSDNPNDGVKARKVALVKSYLDNLRNISEACKAVGVNRGTFYNFYKHDEKFKKEIDWVSEEIDDYVEGKLLGLIAANDRQAILFYCKTKLKHRGYGLMSYEEPKEQGNGGAVVIDITPAEKEVLRGIADKAFFIND